MTPRLVLRPPRPEDAEVIANLVGNWNVVRWLARVPFPYAMADAEAFITDTLAATPLRGVATAAITREGQLIGMAGIEARGRGREFGYWLGEPYWGNGYMTEATRALSRAFFQAAPADELHAGYFDGNLASARILAKLGFEEIGRGVLYCLALGQPLPHIDLRLTADRFRKLNS